MISKIDIIMSVFPVFRLREMIQFRNTELEEMGCVLTTTVAVRLNPVT